MLPSAGRRRLPGWRYTASPRRSLRMIHTPRYRSARPPVTLPSRRTAVPSEADSSAAARLHAASARHARAVHATPIELVATDHRVTCYGRGASAGGFSSRHASFMLQRSAAHTEITSRHR